MQSCWEIWKPISWGNPILSSILFPIFYCRKVHTIRVGKLFCNLNVKTMSPIHSITVRSISPFTHFPSFWVAMNGTSLLSSIQVTPKPWILLLLWHAIPLLKTKSLLLSSPLYLEILIFGHSGWESRIILYVIWPISSVCIWGVDLIDIKMKSKEGRCCRSYVCVATCRLYKSYNL